MVAGIDRFALREIDEAAKRRKSLWSLDDSSPQAYASSLQPYRDRFAERIGVVDSRVEAEGIELIATLEQSFARCRERSIRDPCGSLACARRHRCRRPVPASERGDRCARRRHCRMPTGPRK